MKLFNQSSSSGSAVDVSGYVLKAGDIVQTLNYKNPVDFPTLFDITYSSFKGEYASYPDLQVTSDIGPTATGLPVSESYPDSLKIPYNNVVTYDIGDSFLMVGQNIFAGNSETIRISKLKKSEWEEIIPVDINVGFPVSDVGFTFDGTYIYAFRKTKAYDTNFFIESFFKININDFTYEEISFKKRRIIKAYYDPTISKFVFYELNTVDDNDSDLSTSGVFICDSFEELKTIPDQSCEKLNFSSTQNSGMVQQLNGCFLRKKNGDYIYIDITTKELKNYSDDSVISTINVRDGATFSSYIYIYELYNKIFVDWEESLSPNYLKSFLCVDENNNSTYCYPAEPFNSCLIFDDVFNYDFSLPEPYGPAVVYTNNSNIRKALTFSSVVDNQHEFNLNVVDPGFSYTAIEYYVRNDDYRNLIIRDEGDYGWRLYDNFGTLDTKTYSIIDLKFNGFGVPFIYIPAKGLINGFYTYLITRNEV